MDGFIQDNQLVGNCMQGDVASSSAALRPIFQTIIHSTGACSGVGTMRSKPAD